MARLKPLSGIGMLRVELNWTGLGFDASNSYEFASESGEVTRVVVDPDSPTFGEASQFFCCGVFWDVCIVKLFSKALALKHLNPLMPNAEIGSSLLPKTKANVPEADQATVKLRERVKCRRSQKVNDTGKSESDVATDGNQQPDLAALSRGLPSGW
ncbi:unnamed protein product [Fraxinus pennsylvanica]|uniref:Uncharacterized protein n=1 Tax=Fraxinus pennsylvanica TaxID=56036 RepID=A0AAD2A9N0_9LAMI|nr:unnamed protein product [Fraxinus pennsylvanica]